MYYVHVTHPVTRGLCMPCVWCMCVSHAAGRRTCAFPEASLRFVLVCHVCYPTVPRLESVRVRVCVRLRVCDVNVPCKQR